MSLFTIEQVELIRRLRKSGVTRWQVIEAYDQLERMEMECHPIVHTAVPPSASPLPPSPAGSAVSQPLSLGQRAAAAAHGDRHSSSPLPATSSQPSPGQRAPPHKPPPPHIPLPLLSPLASGPPTSVSASHAMLMAHGSGHGHHQVSSGGAAVAAAAHTPMPSPGVLGHASQLRTPPIMRHNRYLLSPLGRREAFCFTGAPPGNSSGGGSLAPATHHHSKSDLQATAVSAAAISASAAAADDSLCHKQEAMGEDSLGTADDAASAPGGSRSSQPWHHVKSRFIFRKGHLAILEEQFKRNQYPDAEQRRDIAETCNRAYPSSSSRVTPMIVLNWFSNKRKAVRNHLKGRVITGSSRELVERVLQNISPSAAHYLFQGAPNTSGGTSMIGHVSQGDMDAIHAFSPYGHVPAASAAMAAVAPPGSAASDSRAADSPGGASFDESDSGSDSAASRPSSVVCKTEAV